MDAFIVIMGVLLLIVVAAVIIMYKKGFSAKLYNVQVKHWLIVIGIVLAIMTVIVVKIFVGKKSRLADELLSKLRRTKAESDLKVIDEKLNNNKEKSGKIDEQLKVLDKDLDINKDKIEKLNKQKESVDAKISTLDAQYSDKKTDKESLEEKVKKMKERLNRG